MNIAVIFAGGVGNRMNSNDIPKQFLLVNGKPIIIHTLEHFQKHTEIHAIVVASISEGIDYLRQECAKHHITKVKKIVPGGNSGQESIYKALLAAQELSQCDGDIVLIHDGVRPKITERLITDNISSVKEFGIAISASRAVETFSFVNDDLNIEEIIPRKNSYMAKAPQSFYLKDICTWHELAIEEGKFDFIDSASLAMYYKEDSKKLHIVETSADNIKITNQTDFRIFKTLMDDKELQQLRDDNDD